MVYTYNENNELRIIQTFFKLTDTEEKIIEKMSPPEPDFLVNGNCYYEVTSCTQNKKVAQLEHMYNQQKDIQKILSETSNVEDSHEMLTSIIQAIEKKKQKKYSLKNDITELNLLIGVYPAFNIAKFQEELKTKIKDTGQFSNIYIQTGYGILKIPKDMNAQIMQFQFIGSCFL
jgi:hypothetical protein